MDGMPGSRVGPPSLSSQLPAAFPSILSLLSRSFLLFHHVGWGASAPATAATDWPATATQAQYEHGKFHSYFASTLRSRSGRPENGRGKELLFLLRSLCKRIIPRCGWVMLACTRLFHSHWLYKPTCDYIFRYYAETLPRLIIPA